MIAGSRSSRVARRLAICVTLLVSNYSQVLFIGLSLPVRALTAQKPITKGSNRSGAEQSTRRDGDGSLTRPRRVDEAQNPDVSQQARGPIIRVALMTDVSSLSLNSPSPLIVRYEVAGRIQSETIPNGQLTIECRQQRRKIEPLLSTTSIFRVSVGSSNDIREARKLLDELKKKFFEPVSVSFNEKENEFSVLIGEFSNRQEASSFLERLRKSGYENLRLVNETRPDDSSTNDTVDTNARAAKYKAQQASMGSRRSAVSSPASTRQFTELIALSANKITASSNEKLVISSADTNTSFDRPPRASEESDKDARYVIRRGESEPLTGSGENAPSSAISIGNKRYRGDIHLILNSRGRINVVNALPLEDYLRGVVPMELSPGAYPEMEALKAQAVAARSYALAHLGRHSADGFDLVDDTRDQVYGGLSAEREMTNRAIDETRGIAAVFQNDRGELVPIEALYTANCGGRTENNEEVFGGKPVSYLRAVACAPDRKTFGGSDIVTSRTREPQVGIDGRSINREIALLSVSGFSLPSRVPNSYLGHPPDIDEMKSWLERLAQLSQKDAPVITQKDAVRLAEFIQILAMAIYGKGRASTLLAPADIDYLLSGFQIVQLPGAARAETALLLKDGILRLPADGLDGRSQISRGQVLECVARAIWKVSRPNNASVQSSDPKANTGLNSTNLVFKSDTSVLFENGRLILASASPVRDPVRSPRFTSVNTTSTTRVGRNQQAGLPKKEPSTEDRVAADGLRSVNKTAGLEISEGAWLFRTFGAESQQVERLMIIGGERVTYHLNSKGQVDFLETSISDRSASSDRFSSVAQWQERITIDEIQQRLARANIKVGHLDRIEPVSFSSSSRVTEVEVSGDGGSYILRRPNIRGVLGLKEYLFVVDREVDTRGKLIAFVFTGRGWGHGVGMCQVGAYGLAKEGYSYSDILKKYYTGIKLQKRY